MKKFDIESFPGTITSKGEFNRINKLLASPNSQIQAPDFAMGLVVIEPGHGHPIHHHPGNREICVVLKGETVLHQQEGDEGVLMKEGDFFGFDFDEPHGFWNEGTETLYMLWTYYPPGNAENRFLNKEYAD